MGMGGGGGVSGGRWKEGSWVCCRGGSGSDSVRESALSTVTQSHRHTEEYTATGIMTADLYSQCNG